MLWILEDSEVLQPYLQSLAAEEIWREVIVLLSKRREVRIEIEVEVVDVGCGSLELWLEN